MNQRIKDRKAAFYAELEAYLADDGKTAKECARNLQKIMESKNTLKKQSEIRPNDVIGYEESNVQVGYISPERRREIMALIEEDSIEE